MKTSLSKLKRTQVTQSMFSDHGGIKLGSNKRSLENPNSWKLNNTLVNEKCIKEIKWKIIERFELEKMKTKHLKLH